MKLINIPVLCALPRLYEKAVDLLTAEPEESPDSNTVAILRGEIFKLNEKLDKRKRIKKEVVEEIPVTKVADINEVYTTQSPNLQETVNKIAKELDIKRQDQLDAMSQRRKDIKKMDEILAASDREELEKQQRIKDLDDKVNKRLKKNVEVLNDKMPGTMTTIEKKKKARRKPYTQCMVKFTVAHWDQTQFRYKQLLAWNKANPDKKRTKTAWHAAMNREFGMTYSGDFYNNVIDKKALWHKARRKCHPANGIKFDKSVKIVTDFADMHKLYEV